MENKKISIIGLGYVGLPLAVLFAEKYRVIGFDINTKRINEINSFVDKTNEIESSKLKAVLSSSLEKGLKVTSDENELKNSEIYIITVPTPIDKTNKPDLTPLINASKLAGKYLEKGSIVIYESTVYPGATEDDCVPILEKESSLKFNKDFYVGY